MGPRRALLRRGRTRDGGRRPVARHPRQRRGQHPQAAALLLAHRPVVAALRQGHIVDRPPAFRPRLAGNRRHDPPPRPPFVLGEDSRSRRLCSGDDLYVLGQGSIGADRRRDVLPDLGRPVGVRGLAGGRPRRPPGGSDLLGRRSPGGTREGPGGPAAAAGDRPGDPRRRPGNPTLAPLCAADRSARLRPHLRRLGGRRHAVGARRVLGLGRAQGALRRSRDPRHAPRPAVVVLRQGPARAAPAVDLPRPRRAGAGVAAARPHGPLPAGDGRSSSSSSFRSRPKNGPSTCCRPFPHLRS